MLIQKYRRQHISVALLADRFLPGLQHLGIASGQQPQLSWAQQPPSDHCWTEHSLWEQQGPVWWQGIQHSSDLQQLWRGQRLQGREDKSSDRRVVTSYSVNWGLISTKPEYGRTKKNRFMSLISWRQVWIISILCRVEDAFKPLIFFSFICENMCWTISSFDTSWGFLFVKYVENSLLLAYIKVPDSRLLRCYEMEQARASWLAC